MHPSKMTIKNMRNDKLLEIFSQGDTWKLKMCILSENEMKKK